MSLTVIWLCGWVAVFEKTKRLNLHNKTIDRDRCSLMHMCFCKINCVDQNLKEKCYWMNCWTLEGFDSFDNMGQVDLNLWTLKSTLWTTLYHQNLLLSAPLECWKNIITRNHTYCKNICRINNGCLFVGNDLESFSRYLWSYFQQ